MNLALPDFHERPGLYFVAATLVPLASFLLIFLASGVWGALRPYRETGWGAPLYNLFGGDVPGRGPAYVALAAIALACAFSVTGFVLYLTDQASYEGNTTEAEQAARDLRSERDTAPPGQREELERKLEEQEKPRPRHEQMWEHRREHAWQ